MTSGGVAKEPEGEGREGVTEPLGGGGSFGILRRASAYTRQEGVAFRGSAMDRAGLREGVAICN